MAVWDIFAVSILLITAVNHVYAETVEYDFEDSTEVSNFVLPATSSVATSTTRYKLGTKSLLWTYGANDTLRLDLSSKNIAGKSTRSGGMKIWIYNEESMASKCFTVKITTTEAVSSSSSCPGGSDITHTSEFHISLKFTGWRAVWIGYADFESCPSTYPTKMSSCTYDEKKVTMMEIEAPNVEGSQTVYVDALRFYDKIRHQSRDEIVPLVTSSCHTCANLNTVTEAEAIATYSRSNFWQQTYRWGAVVTAPEAPTLEAADLSSKVSDIRLIEKRFDNWYADEKTTFIKLALTAGAAYPTGVATDNFYLRKRWDDLMSNVDKAYEEFRKLQITKSSSTPPVITGSGLFTKFSEKGGSKTPGGDSKYGTVMHKVLLPLALEYYLKSRPLEVTNTLCQWAKAFTDGTTPGDSNDNLIAVVGKDSLMKQTFTTAYTSHTGTDSLPSECTTGANVDAYRKIKHAITQLNNRRKENLLLLFDYLEDQGWTAGSAAGTTSHEMNQSGAGFSNAVFVLRKMLETAGKLESIVATLKWYTDFNEIYQTPNYEFKGTTADRMRTILLYRLMAVLMMPEEDSSATLKPKSQAKVHAMTEWKRWYDNAVAINKGMGGVIKPDFTGFHHHGFYGSAYTPHALHCASIARFLINGTSFSTGSSDLASRENVKNALDVLRIVSVLYSAPNSISGRFPGYYRGTLARNLVAPYGYFAAASPIIETDSETSKLGGLGNLTIPVAKEFLRFYDFGTANDCGDSAMADDFALRELKGSLCEGRVRSAITYYNTLGSLQIMQKVKEKADSQSLVKEDAPVGHWTKNFAAMSIHRREDWAVTMKGFNKFVWDTETSDNQNVFGLYSSHGALQISNSEDELKRFDIDNGWDWRKVPGTTTIGFNISDLRTDNNRRLNPQELAGGVTFSGKNPYDKATLNGVFGQDFTQPDYRLPDDSPREDVSFSFKKSVFFEDDFLVCLGSHITASGAGNGAETYTTLFQTKLLATDTFSADSSEIYKCGNASAAKSPEDWGEASSVVLEDISGNRYFVKNPRDNGLNFEPRKNQISYKSNGKTDKTTEAEYCTAWFNHGLNQEGKAYEYTVQIKGNAAISTSLTASDYNVIKTNAKVHAVKISKGVSTRPMFGYVAFLSSTGTISSSGTENGPIYSIRKGPAIVTARYIDTNTLAVSVSSPNLDLKRAPSPPSWCPTSFRNPPTTASSFGDEYKYCAESASDIVRIILQSGLSGNAVSHIFVNGESVTHSNMANNDNLKVGNRGRNLDFKNLKNGFTTEVWLPQTVPA